MTHWFRGWTTLVSKDSSVSRVVLVMLPVRRGSMADRTCCMIPWERRMLAAAMATFGFFSRARLTA